MRENNPILGMLSKLADLLFLNILILIACLPIITIGASLTAGHFVALRIKRDEAKVFSDFWRSFKENFRQATFVWFILASLSISILVLLWFYGKGSVLLSITSIIALLFVFMLGLWVFPLLSRFVYSTGNLIRNSFVLCFRHMFHTIAMFIGAMLPIACLLVVYTLPVAILYGLSLPVYIGACLYNKVFIQLEEAVHESHS